MKNPFYKKAQAAAKKLVDDGPKLLATLDKAKHIAKTYLPFADLRQDFETSLRMIKAFVKGQYKEVPWKSLIMLVAAVIYIVNPMDLVPDFIAGAGFLDDVAVLKMVLSNIALDLEAFRQWEQSLDSAQHRT